MNTIEDRLTGESECVDEALAPGSTLLSGQYEIMRYLSSGGFGITYLAKDSLNRTVVIKECFPEAFCARENRTVRARTQNYVADFRSSVQLFIREAHALSRLDHPSVVGVHQVFEDNETAYMALDLVDGKDLLEIIEAGNPALSPPMVRKLTLSLLDAISHVHSQDLLHRDISPDNILLDASGHPVLIDFGAAREEASRKSRALSAVLVVKDGYSPQEFYVAGSKQAPCSDLYALAATLVHVITGAAPPNSQARLAAMASDKIDLYEPLVGRVSGFDDAFLSAIDKAMHIVPSERLQSAEDWVLMIDHTKRIEKARAEVQHNDLIDETVIKLVESAKSSATHTGAGRSATANAQAGAQAAEAQTDERVQDLLATVLDEEAPDDDAKSVEVLEALTEQEKQVAAVQKTVAQKETPYVRVTSRAMAAAKEKAARQAEAVVATPRRMSRFATVPVVFSAYLFYGHTLLQHDELHAAALQPILAFGEGIGSWSVEEPASPPAVVIRRGTGS